LSRLNPITVLVTASGTFSSPSVIDCLKNNYEKRKIRIITADKKNQSIMEYKSDKFSLLPQGGSKNYISELIKLCKKEKIDVILPCSSSEVITISKNITILAKHHIKACVSEYKAIKKTETKFDLYESLKTLNKILPKYYLAKNKSEFQKCIKLLGYPKKPVCFKPSIFAHTGGGRGFRILRKKNLLSDIILKQKPDSKEIDFGTAIRLFDDNKKHELLVMEFLPGDEYWVYVFAERGKILYSIPLKKIRVEQGFAFEAVVKNYKNLLNICKNITERFGFSYNVNIQFRLSKNGNLKLLEINPRIAGAIALPMASGVNLPYLSVKKALGENLPKLHPKHDTTMIRYWKEFYLVNGKTVQF